MDVKTFIEETLFQVVEGVKSAQSKDGSRSINAEIPSASGGNLINGGSYGVFTRVDFDLAVSAETSGGGKGSLKVFGVGAEGGGEHKTGYANRITFSVPVRLPDGARKPQTRSR